MNVTIFIVHVRNGSYANDISQHFLSFQENCVAIRMWKGHEGKWADVACDQAFASLCQAKQGILFILNILMLKDKM